MKPQNVSQTVYQKMNSKHQTSIATGRGGYQGKALHVLNLNVKSHTSISNSNGRGDRADGALVNEKYSDLATTLKKADQQDPSPNGQTRPPDATPLTDQKGQSPDVSSDYRYEYQLEDAEKQDDERESIPREEDD